MKDDDLLYVLPSAGISLIACASKAVHYPLIESRNNLIKCYSEGLYHITSDEAADKIIESQSVHASGFFASYGAKRSFFFGGKPDFENICLNCTPGITLTAIRVMLPYERLAEFDRRGLNDGAITFRGDLSLEGAKVEKVRLGLKERNGELCYEQISEEEYQNYKVDLSEDKMKIVNNNLAFKLKSMIAGMRKEFDLFKSNFGEVFERLIREEDSFIRVPKSRRDYIDENSDIFENTDQLPVIEVDNSHEDAISMFEEINKKPLEERIDNKRDLLKSVVGNVIGDINNGIMPDMSKTIITPAMSDKDIRDVIYNNLCQGKVDECYGLLDNPVVLFSVCKGMVDYQKNTPNIQDPRIGFLNRDIDNYSDNLKQNYLNSMSF